MDEHRDIVNPADKFVTIPLPSFFRPLENSTSSKPMEIPVHPPPPELFQNLQNSRVLHILYKTPSSTIRYPGKVDRVDAQGEASQSSVAIKDSMFTIPRNSDGLRIDPIIDVSEELVEEVKKKKACKDAYLRGKCRRKPCHFGHGVLETQELDGLRQYARQLPCRYGSKCLDASCYWGHLCPWGPGCELHHCSFGKMHVVDFQVNHYVHQR